MVNSGLNSRLVGIYQSVANARQALILAMPTKDPVNGDCQRLHDLINRVANLSLAIALRELQDILTDVATVEQLRNHDLRFIDQLKEDAE